MLFFVPHIQNEWCIHARTPTCSSHRLCTPKQMWKINRFWIASEWNVILHFISLLTCRPNCTCCGACAVYSKSHHSDWIVRTVTYNTLALRWAWWWCFLFFTALYFFTCLVWTIEMGTIEIANAKKQSDRPDPRANCSKQLTVYNWTAEISMVSKLSHFI